MKKVLAMLFLLFGLYTTNVSTATMMEIDQGLIDYINKRNDLVELLSINTGETAKEAYLHWDSIPIQSPMNMSDISRLSSDYGYRKHPILKIRTMHNGIDLAGNLGADIYSTADGVVTKTAYGPFGYGNFVLVKHANGYETRYAHLNEINVREGDKVRRGDIVGFLGTTGLSTGPHLHYEVIKNGNPIDPLFFSYKAKEERSFENYQTTLIALEETKRLGMYHHRNVTGHF